MQSICQRMKLIRLIPLRTLGVQFVSEESRTFKTYGYAGQSFGALMNESVELIHTGYANDYVGKGLSGGHITVKADETTRQKPIKIRLIQIIT